MRKAKLLSAALAASMLLTACGSGSGAASATTAASGQGGEAKTEAKAEAGKSEEKNESESESTPMITFQNCNDYDVYYYDQITPDASRKSTVNTDERYPAITIAGPGPSELQPYNTTDQYKENFIWECYEFLLYRTANGEYEGRLAKDWKWEDDTHFLVTLYDYIHDWEGNPIKASDVVFSYNLCVDSGYATGFEGFGYDSCEVVDDYTVRFNFKQKPTTVVAFNDIFAKLVCIVSEKAYGEHNFAVDPVGTGPYKLKEFITDSKFVMEANDDYWQKDELRSEYAKANVQEITSLDMEETFQMMNGLLDGTLLNDIDFEDEDLPKFLPGGEYAGQYNLMISPGANVHGTIPNCSANSPMSDINFRMAVWYAIDNEAIASALSMRYTPATVVSNPAVEDWNDEWFTWKNCISDYDPELAKEYLAKTDYKGEEIVIVLDKSYKALAQVMQGYLAEVGINASINIVDKALINDEVADPTKWDIYLYKSRNQKPAACKLQDFLDANYGVAEGKNLAQVEDPKLQEMIETATGADTYSKENTDALMQYVIDNGYVYSTFYPLSVHLYNKKVAGFCWRYGTSKPVLGACDYYFD